jgi:hypothetical protein
MTKYTLAPEKALSKVLENLRGRSTREHKTRCCYPNDLYLNILNKFPRAYSLVNVYNAINPGSKFDPSKRREQI